MAKIYIMQTGRTTWDEESRVASPSGCPLSREGSEKVVAAATELPAKEIAAVYSGSGAAERQTAALVARQLKVRAKMHKGLGEFDFGLWQGLTLEEIERRNPKVFREWMERPAGVRPPGGEMLDEAQERLRWAMNEILRRLKKRPLLFVLSPVATGLVRCVLQHKLAEELWQHVDSGFAWCTYEVADGCGLS